jgi:hypothetical protein
VLDQTHPYQLALPLENLNAIVLVLWLEAIAQYTTYTENLYSTNGRFGRETVGCC